MEKMKEIQNKIVNSIIELVEAGGSLSEKKIIMDAEINFK